MVFPFYSCLCVCILLLLLNVDCWQVLQYGRVDEWGPVATIPDPKWHFFEVFADNGVYFAADLTPSAPVLRYCALDELYRVYIKKGDPRFELLILMHHANGEHLVNLTYDDGNVHLNNKFLFKCKVWIIPGDRTELHIRKEKLGFILWATTERQGLHLIGNGPNENPEHEWQYVMSEGRRCFEIKAKVAVGSVKFTVLRKWIGWPTEPYDDVFFETTTTITTTTTTTTNVPENGQNNFIINC
uniref:LAM_G_DOMAIN domain-containing protein n=1 Tax=Panagrellus redivivus TaxID=6233 RepID=A0A7E4VV34_PANRE